MARGQVLEQAGQIGDAHITGAAVDLADLHQLDARQLTALREVEVRLFIGHIPFFFGTDGIVPLGKPVEGIHTVRHIDLLRIFVHQRGDYRGIRRRNGATAGRRALSALLAYGHAAGFRVLRADYLRRQQSCQHQQRHRRAKESLFHREPSCCLYFSAIP